MRIEKWSFPPLSIHSCVTVFKNPRWTTINETTSSVCLYGDFGIWKESNLSWIHRVVAAMLKGYNKGVIPVVIQIQKPTDHPYFHYSWPKCPLKLKKKKKSNYFLKEEPIIICFWLFFPQHKKRTWFFKFSPCHVIESYLGPKFSTLLGHMIKCLLTNLGRAEWENIWLSVKTYRQRPTGIKEKNLFTCFELINYFFYSILPESPRWLVAQGRTDEASRILVKFSNNNSRPFDPDLLRSALDNCHRGEADEETTKPKHSPLDLLRTPRMRKRTLIFWFNW